MGCSINGFFNSVSEFFQRCFRKLGVFIGTYPVALIPICIIVTAGLSIGMITLSSETSTEVLYTPVNSRASKDRTKYQATFTDMTGSQYFKSAITSDDMFADLIVSAADKNVFSSVSMPEIVVYIDQIKALNATYNGTTFSFADVCARAGVECSVSGEFLTKSPVLDAIRNKVVTYPRWNNVNLESLLADVDSTGGKLVSAVYMRLSFNLRQDTAANKAKARAWEEAFIEFVPKLNSSKTSVVYGASHSLDVELNSNTGGDIVFFSITFTLMITYATIVAGGDMVSSRTWASWAGVYAAGFGVLSSFGLISACGVKFVNIVGVMPFLIIGIGVDDMFLLMSGWAETYPHTDKTVAKRMGMTFASAGIGITITSITDLLAFVIGASSVFISVRNFCIYTGVAVIFTYLYQCFFFGSCLAIHGRRVDESMHCITCLKKKTRKAYREEGKSQLYVLCCGGSPPIERGQDERIFESLPRKYLPRLILNIPACVIIIILFLGYLGVSIWGVINLQQGLQLKNLASSTSYYNSYAEILESKFGNDFPIPFVFESMNYIDVSDINEMESVLTKAGQDVNVNNDSLSCWFHEYRDSAQYQNNNLPNFIAGLMSFLTTKPVFQNDVVFDKTNSSITASRCYLFSEDVKDSNGQADLMVRIRALAEDSSLQVYIFHPAYIYFEQFIAILPSTLQTVGIALAVMTVVTFIFLPHPLLVLLVVVNILSILVGIFGFLYIWNLSLSSVTMIHLIMSVGFSVDFSVHVCSAYMLGEGETRRDKVESAIVHAAGPILNGGMSSFLGIIVLAFSQSYIFNSFFKIMFTVILFGILHAVFLLPVILYLCGPLTRVQRVRQSPVMSSASLRAAAHNRSGYTSRPMSPKNGYPSPMHFPIPGNVTGSHLVDHQLNGKAVQDGYGKNFFNASIIPRAQSPQPRPPTNARPEIFYIGSTPATDTDHAAIYARSRPTRAEMRHLSPRRPPTPPPDYD